MIIKARINGNDNSIYKLCEWNTASFTSDPVLKLQTSDLATVKEVFSNITKIEIFQANVPICEYTLYDTYSSIVYHGQVYVAHENVFADCLEIRLSRSSLVDQVQRIEETLNNNVDTEAMTVSEYRTFVLQNISKDCEEDIYLGTSIDIDGTMQSFSFKAEDQINLLQLYLMTQMYPAITAVPYHSNGQTCMFYTAQQIKTIYMTMIVRLISITTYANQLNLYAQTLTTKEELSTLRYGMELPMQYARVVSDIVSETISVLNDVTATEESEETNEETNNENE